MLTTLYKPLLTTFLVFLAACGASEEAAETIPAVEEIPTTASSEKALKSIRKGQYYLDVGRREDANEHFRTVLEEDSTCVRGNLGIANSAFSVEEELEGLERASRHKGAVTEGEQLLLEIELASHENDQDRRLALAEALVKAYPTSPRAWLTLGQVLADRKEVIRSRKAIERALDLDRDMIGAHHALIASYLFSPPFAYDRAWYHVDRVLEIEPDEPMGYTHLGDVLRAKEDLEGAREAYTVALKKDADFGLAALKRAIVNTFLGNLEEARADYRLAAEVSQPSMGFNFANYGSFVHLYQGHPARAIDELMELDESVKASGIGADQVRAVRRFTLSNAATIALHHEFLHEAKDLLHELEAVIRTDVEHVDDEDYARRQEAVVRIWQGRLAARAGKYEIARKRAEEYRELRESDTDPHRLEPYHDLRGLIALLQGEYEEAILQYEQANLEEMYARFHLGLARDGAGQWEDAQEIFSDVAGYQFVEVGTALVRNEAMARISD
jgi:tetratricopeptide (TPR) repeat protein